MPLNRDQHDKSKMLKSVAEYTSDKQQARESEIQKSSGHHTHALQGSLHSRSQSQNSQEDPNPVARNELKKHPLLASFNQSTFSAASAGMKMPVPDTMSLAKSRIVSSGPQYPISDFQNSGIQQPSTAATRQPNDKALPKASAFDDTTSLDPSLLADNGLEENVTAVFRPPRAVKHEPGQDSPTDSDDAAGRLAYDTQAATGSLGYGDRWLDEVEEAKEFHRRHNPGIFEASRRVTPYVDLRDSDGDSIETGSKHAFDEPETPSRIRSVLLDPEKLQAPVPHRAVNFKSTPEVFRGIGDSPAFHSAEMAREESTISATSRPQSAQPRTRSPYQKSHRKIPYRAAGQQQALVEAAAPPDRYQRVENQRQRTQPTSLQLKVSPTESEMQELSEDEGKGESNPENEGRRVRTANQKRTAEYDNSLDYDQVELLKRSLGDLQSEPFTKDPQQGAAMPLRDNHGVDMTLFQILENLSKLNSDQQRDVFRAQTDQEWEETGQWFVDKFQADLKELMEVRLNRRKIALKYEDKIRRRQKAVEFQQAAVDKELEVLQDGGNGLLRDRRPLAASRSGTPMRPAQS